VTGILARCRCRTASATLASPYSGQLIRDGHDLVLVAELMGHARTETTWGYSLPTAADAQAAINSLPADR
jgi:site-specific recombinase XerD